MTQLKKMKQMNDEELGRFFKSLFHITTITSEELSRAIYYGINCNDCPLYDSCGQNLGACNVNLKSWLNSEAEE